MSTAVHVTDHEILTTPICGPQLRIRYCTTNFTGLKIIPAGSDSSLCMNACWTTASLSPVLTLGGICVPPAVNYLQYLANGSTLNGRQDFSVAAHSQSGTFSRISPRTRPSVQTVSDVCLKCICSLVHSFSVLLWVVDTAVFSVVGSPLQPRRPTISLLTACVDYDITLWCLLLLCNKTC